MADVTLRPLTIDDADVLFRLVEESRACLSSWFLWPDAIVCRDTAQAAIEAYLTTTKVKHWWLVFENGHPVGGIQMRLRDGGKAVALPYWLVPSAQGRGVMTTAVRQAIQAVWVIGYRTVKFIINDGNKGSVGVAERVGLERTNHFVTESFRGDTRTNRIWVLHG